MEDALRQSAAQGRHLADVLEENQEVTEHLGAAALQDIEKPEQYLGSAEEFRKRLLDSAQKRSSSVKE